MKEGCGSAPAAGLWRHAEFRVGVRDTFGASLGMAAWGLVTGMAMIKGGLGLPLSLMMTFVVYAGSAQLATLPLVVASAPLWLIWATAFCVNLRFVIFSAQWRPFVMHLPLWKRLWQGYLTTDMTHVLCMRRFEAAVDPQALSDEARRGQSAFFWGSTITNWLAWQTASLLGICLAEFIPEAWGIGFAGTLALLGVAASLVTDRITVTAAVVAGAASVAAFALPMKLNIVLAIACAVAVGVMWDSWGRPTEANDGGRP